MLPTKWTNGREGGEEVAYPISSQDMKGPSVIP